MVYVWCMLAVFKANVVIRIIPPSLAINLKISFIRALSLVFNRQSYAEVVMFLFLI